MLVTLAAVGPVAAAVVLGEVLVYQQVENYLLNPWISRKAMELNAGVAFAAAMVGGAVGGFIGAFFALPIAAVVHAFLSTYSRRYEVVESDLAELDTPKPPSPTPSGVNSTDCWAANGEMIEPAARRAGTRVSGRRGRSSTARRRTRPPR